MQICRASQHLLQTLIDRNLLLRLPVHRYIKFDTFHPAVDKGLPVTRVISRVTLQQILARAVERLAGDQVIYNSSNVVGFQDIVDPATGRRPSSLSNVCNYAPYAA
jgi:hypothetical protein